MEPSGAQMELKWNSNGAQMEVTWSRVLVLNEGRDVLLNVICIMYNVYNIYIIIIILIILYILIRTCLGASSVHDIE